MNRCIQVAALLAIVLAGCSHPKATAERQPIPVKVRTAEQTSGAALGRYSGSLEPAVRVDMAFRVGGYVEALGEVVTEDGRRRAVDKGDLVKKGSLLARVRSGDYVQKVASARASFSEAQARSRLDDLELERSRRLLDTNAITKAEHDARAARAESARANVDAALARLREAAIALDDTTLRAPMDGVILSRQVEVGTLAAPGQPAISIADLKTVKAVFAVPQALVERIHVGSPLQVYVGAEGESKAPEERVDTRVSRIAPSADAKGRVFSVEAELPNARGALRPGAVISVHIPGASRDGASVAVPLSAIVRSPHDPRGFAVFVLDGEADRAPARVRDVRVGEVHGNTITVTEGLTSGQRVVTVGSTLLRDGNDAVVVR
jgi:RND family efflux transporter MFP subunit